jgi:type III secretory pathway component EscS
MFDIALLAGVPLAVATFCGVVIAFVQAITQIQDQSLSQTVKIFAIVIVLLSFGGVLTGPLLNSTTQVFDNFDLIVR